MKRASFFLASVLWCFSSFANDPYEGVELLPFDPAGYFATEKSLDTVFNQRNIKVVIELGSWAGASTRYFGRRVGDQGTVYAVDHWEGTANHKGELTDPRLPYIFELFLSNICHAGLTKRVIPVRMSSDEATDALGNVQADLVYIDSSRDSNQVYRDILNWSYHLNEEGTICGTEWREPAVRAGVERAAEELGREIKKDRKGHFWQLH